MLQHRVAPFDIFEFAQDGFGRRFALGPEVPAQIADPQYQFGDRRGARIDLNPQELVRIDLVAFKPQGLLAAQRSIVSSTSPSSRFISSSVT